MKTIIIGFDAFDPKIFERLYDQGDMPNLAELVEIGGYRRFEITNPAQSEVSWTSIATGLNPGGHGLFDFVHRNPIDYSLHVSMLPTKKQIFGIQFRPPHSAQTVFDYAVQQGYPAKVLWWPATFPARLDTSVHTFPGLGTPDILGRLGSGAFFSPDPKLSTANYKTKIGILQSEGRSIFKGQIKGPVQRKKRGTHPTALDFELEILDDARARLRINNINVDLIKGKWSPILHVAFKIRIGVSVHAVTRAIMNHHPAGMGVYFLPLQIHPLHSPWPYATPPGFVKRTWKEFGPFLTLGWPQDTTGLEEGFINDDQFLELCSSIVSTREKIFINQITSFNDGILANVFDSLDRIQHMFLRDHPDIIEKWYMEFDSLYGRIQDQMTKIGLQDTCLLVLSDHGFAHHDFKVHLNRWLIDQGYLVPKEPRKSGGLSDVEWEQSRAYALGLTSIYINQAGREGRGVVREDEKERIKEVIRNKLLQWRGPDGRNVFTNIWFGEEAFSGSLAKHGPDLVVGYNTGYRASQKTGLGEWEQDPINPNGDHWGADHCMDPSLVQGVFFANRHCGDSPTLSYEDIPEYILDHPFEPQETSSGDLPEFNEEDAETLEERLRDLGYL